jgi:hypothetical protein
MVTYILAKLLVEVQVLFLENEVQAASIDEPVTYPTEHW